MDKTSQKAFEITKNVTESNADTLANVRSGGMVGILKGEITQLRAENDRLKEMLIEERLPVFCMGVECGCIERVGEARKKERIKLRKELDQALKE